jgi:hypothetical protein
VADVKLSADGMYYWDGKYWVRTLSPDGRYRWNGSEWVPVAVPLAPQYPYAAPKTGRVPTAWTEPMQYAVAALNALTILYLVASAFLLSSEVSQIFNQALQQSAAQNPSASPPPEQVVNVLGNFFTFVFWGGAFLGSVVAAVVIIGALKRWTWMFYVVLVFLGLSTIGLPFSLIAAVGASTVSGIGGLPAWERWLQVLIGIPSAALFVWMLIGVIRYGPWAQTRNLDWPSGAQAPVS